MINSENDNIIHIAEKIDVIIEALFSSEDITKLDYVKNLVLDINDNVLFNIADEISDYINIELLNKHQINTSHLIPMRNEVIQYIKDILIGNPINDDNIGNPIDDAVIDKRIVRFSNEITYIDNVVKDDDELFNINNATKDNELTNINNAIKDDELTNINNVTKDDESININANTKKVRKTRSISVIRDIIVGNSCEQNFPVPSRVWTRGERQCYPYNRYSKVTIDMRRKAEILKHANNNINLSKKHQYAMLAKGFLRKKKSWSTQTTTATDCNTRSLPVSGRIGPKTPVGTILICNNGQTNCASTTASDVPGTPMELCYQKEVPLVNYKVKRTYLTGVGKWPQTMWQPGDMGFPRGKSGSG